MTLSLLVIILGWAGAVTLLTAYALVSMKKIAGQSISFQCLNILGSLGLGTASAREGVWSAVTVNAAWIAIGIFFLARRIIPGTVCAGRRPGLRVRNKVTRTIDRIFHIDKKHSREEQ